ncbi:hypothetical protein ACGFR6_35665 [Streptomyces sp. NPDC048567]|uniref:hypothetical protein n=1 Tax=unclassified Streptomyces TaxID=2593676 RepID=UPI00093ED062|nr:MULTISPECIES: hypothetical protein [unclassified Streptomyces]OKJ73008.1 hypothetical protein AMK30_18830 [Streptomyces sp. CB02460]WUD03805.1 hypothetical protein OHS17_30985 [Streptomyces sp. NBC_00523]
MGRHAEIARALAMRAKAAKLKSDGAALGDESLKAEGRRRETAGRIAQAEAKAARRTDRH